MLLINTPILRILIGYCHQTLNIDPNTHFTTPHRKKCSSNVAQNRAEHALVPSASHRHTQQLAYQYFVLAVVQFLAFACFFARGLVLLPAVDLALLVAKVSIITTGAKSQRLRRPTFGLAGEAGNPRDRLEGGRGKHRRVACSPTYRLS